ncbi:MAG: TM0106 family RecB-like putative nuclease [Candidatus Riflebacteria bacterium]|nr:TM0106 family RecB-like putative nuclease [Candidatus Riflebacteria bacterium]
MWFNSGEMVLSPNDLLTFLGCKYASIQDLHVAYGQKTKPEISEDVAIIQDAGLKHEKAYLESLKASGRQVVEIPATGSIAERSDLTVKAMKSGAEVIYQAALYSKPWHGYSDFLIRQKTPSKLGNYSYFPLDTKLKKTATADHLIQLGIYADLIESVQGVLPAEVKIILGDQSAVTIPPASVVYYLREAKSRLAGFLKSPDRSLEPEPCRHCSLCRWKDECENIWVDDDHLWQVANIRKTQILKLREAGINTLTQLSETEENIKIPGLSGETFQKLRKQAVLQKQKTVTGKNEYYLLPESAGRGFQRLPKPDSGDLFFDMEGDPLYPEGLEYLFGVFHRTAGDKFLAFWGHNPDEEKKAFEETMAFFISHLEKHPAAHIYHYNHYEETALKRLSSRYATCEDEVDFLLRHGRLVDLYKVVREGLMVSEPGYSIKNLESFYMEKRSGDVKNAAQSIVVYEHWRRNNDPALLQEIEDYNYDDCKSTALCLDWLLSIRPGRMPWYEKTFEKPENAEEIDKLKAEQLALQQSLVGDTAGHERKVRELVSYLCDFHRREQKPQWWKIFSLQGATDEELIDDRECVGALQLIAEPRVEKNSYICEYRFPIQETKRRKGDKPLIAENLQSAGTIVFMDPASQIIELKRGKRSGLLPNCLSLLPPQPIADKVLRNAIKRFAGSYVNDDGRFTALKQFIECQPPCFTNESSLQEVYESGTINPAVVLKTVSSLQNSVLFIQGPPGCGKTFHSAQIILALLKAGKRVGVSSNSHKAIINLLHGIEKAADKDGFRFSGVKKSDSDSPETMVNGNMIRDVDKKDEINRDDMLIAGTAWLFADPGFEEICDYLFVDEAGQVSLANLISMGVAARNIVLIGDQMQLSQPIQGSHPGESGNSALDYLLKGRATVPADRGIFLDTTWRLHPDICNFISQAVYDGRLRAHRDNAKQSLLLQPDAHPELKEHGISFIPVEHSGCSQMSEPEGEIIKELFASLLQQKYCDRNGKTHAMTAENILVISPYNVQVNYLKSILPAEARVGTVDKFQGQEAEVVLISMVTSGIDELPRDIEFLFSRNRLNVAVSRARSLAVILASPRLLEIPCATVEQLSLVNTLCHLKSCDKRE